MASNAAPTKCAAEGQILKPCSFLHAAMTGPYRNGVGGRGLFLMQLIDIKTGKPTRSAVVLRGGDNGKSEFALSFCPFCAADIHSHFVKQPDPIPEIFAVCWSNGVIEFVGDGLLPDGALPIIKGDEQVVRGIIDQFARLGHDNTTLLVPGIPEALTSTEAESALASFSLRVRSALGQSEGVGGGHA